MKRGFTIFFTMLVASLALSVDVVIYDLLIRSLALSQTATQSQYAVFAADSGTECALYWDFKYADVSTGDSDGSAFATSSRTSTGETGDGATAGTVTCSTQDIVAGGAPLNTSWSVVYPSSGPDINNAATTTFWFSTGAAANAPCVKVEICKAVIPSRTTLLSHGYNTCDAAGTLRLERTLQINY